MLHNKACPRFWESQVLLRKTLANAACLRPALLPASNYLIQIRWTLEKLLMHPCAVMRMRRKITFHIYREFEENIPSYVGDIVKDNRRQHTNLAQVINFQFFHIEFIDKQGNV